MILFRLDGAALARQSRDFGAPRANDQVARWLEFAAA
jgi:hypothetical protein